MAVSTPADWRHVPLPWQRQAWERLNQWLDTGRLPHALLLFDAAGDGNELFATAFAARLLCPQPQNNRACGNCPSCRQFSAGAHPDYHPLTIPEGKTVIGVEQIRGLARSLSLTSQYGHGKVALLYPAGAMNANAANSLLKTLEEPTSGTLLMLVAAHPAQLPATLRSRCQRLPLHAADLAPAIDWLNARQARPDWPALLAIAGGAPLLALEFSGLPLIQRRLDFFRMLLELRAGRRNPIACATELSREPLPLVVRLMQSWVADLIVLASTGNSRTSPVTNDDARDLLQTGLQGLNLRKLHAYLDHVKRVAQLAATPVNAQLMLEQLFMEWADGLQTLATAPLAALTG